MKKLNSIKIRTNMQKGFTIVELMISTAVFSVVLLLMATAIVQIGRMFYKGVTINKTQDTARKVVNDAIDAVQYGAASVTGQFHQKVTTSGITTECVGSVRYTYSLSASLGTKSGQINHVLWKDRVGASGCANSPPNLAQNIPSAGGQELLGPDMRLANFDITPTTGNSYKISITVAYGATDDVFVNNNGVPNYAQCTSTNLGGQFCAVSSITSYATERL